MKWERQNTAYRGEQNPNYRGGRYVPCAQCGTEVYRMPCQLKGKNTFCSPQCHNEFRRKPNEKRPPAVGKHHWRWSGPKFCKFCGSELIGHAKRRRGYCSDDCADKGKLEASKRTSQGSANPNWRGGKVILSCAVCGEDFEVAQNRVDSARYCSTDCMHLDQRNRTKHICEQCGTIFEVPKSREEAQIKKGTPIRFCSVACKLAYRGRTSLEVAIADALTEAGLGFEEQYQICGKQWLYDFYLPNLDLLIEADGDFYHYSDWAIEQGQDKRDRRKGHYARSVGYRLVRIRESEVHEIGADEIVRTRIWPIKVECRALEQLAG